MTLSESNYHESIKSFDGFVIFWAHWDKESSSLKNKLYPDIVSMEFNIDEAPNIPVTLGVNDIPKLGVYKQGKLVELLTAEEFKEKYE